MVFFESIGQNFPKKQRLMLLFLMHPERLFDKPLLIRKTGIEPATLDQYLKELRKRTLIDSISHASLSDAPKLGKKYYYYGEKNFITKIKANPKAYSIKYLWK